VCQPAHPNGLGQSYHDCSPLGTPGDSTSYSQAMAAGAAAAWSAGTDLQIQCGTASCICRTTPGPVQDAAAWCYSGDLAGYVGHTGFPNCLALCPYTKPVTWQ
jgi:hypothetical protein